MTTRALEDTEIKGIFEHIDGTNAKRNSMLLIVGIGMALRVSELIRLNVGDVYDGKRVKPYVTVRAETAKYNKARFFIGDDIIQSLAGFIDWKLGNGESVDLFSPLFIQTRKAI